MSSAPAGWYPDQRGQMRFWDGATWTDQVASPSPPSSPGAATPAPSAKAPGKLARRKNARDERLLGQAEAAREAGPMVTSGVFGTSTIEIYEGGYVRVASGERPDFLGRPSQPGRSMSPGSTVAMKKSVPYERLLSIKFTPSKQDLSSGAGSPLEGALAPSVAKVLKGGRAALKGSLPGLAATGIAHVASTGSRTSYLTITTDKEVHQLTNQGHNGYIKTTNKAHVDVGLALEAAGLATLGESGPTTLHSARAPHLDLNEAQPSRTSPAPAGPTLAARLRELADLHKEGILTDDEFAAAKTRLLDDR